MCCYSVGKPYFCCINSKRRIMVYYHYAELIHRQAEKYGSRTALKYRDDESGKWLKISWREFSEKVMLTAKAMAEFGIEVQEKIGIYSQNMPQCLFTDSWGLWKPGDIDPDVCYEFSGTDRVYH